MRLQPINASASPEVQMNENTEVLEPASLYGRNPITTTGLTWGFYGGYVGSAYTLIANGTITLANNTTNYIEANGAGVVVSNTSGWTSGFTRLYLAVTLVGVITSYTDFRQMFSTPIAGAHIDNETPAGTISGTDGTDGNAIFTLAFAPSPAASLQLFKTDVGTGVLMIVTIHYDLTSNTITYTSGNRPITGMTHRAWYRK